MKQARKQNRKAAKPSTPKKDKQKSSKQSAYDALKLRVTEDLGLLEKVKQVGWGGLSAAESGRVGGIMTRILREQKKQSKA